MFINIGESSDSIDVLHKLYTASQRFLAANADDSGPCGNGILCWT